MTRSCFAMLRCTKARPAALRPRRSRSAWSPLAMSPWSSSSIRSASTSSPITSVGAVFDPGAGFTAASSTRPATSKLVTAPLTIHSLRNSRRLVTCTAVSDERAWRSSDGRMLMMVFQRKVHTLTPRSDACGCPTAPSLSRCTSIETTSSASMSASPASAVATVLCPPTATSAPADKSSSFCFAASRIAASSIASCASRSASSSG
mmetsp:Transcript_16621/g.51535  ORF Transcript_16621/g.51535 Transcript_16621/m.51535 type:complete len:205 (+) Transcript_16621:155-769(+)